MLHWHRWVLASDKHEHGLNVSNVVSCDHATSGLIKHIVARAQEELGYVAAGRCWVFP